MRAIRLIFPLLIVCLAPHLAEAISHQLIDKHFLDIGNRWEYQIHITEDPGAGPVDWWGTAISEIVRNETIEGYDTVLCEDTAEIPGVMNWWVKSNYYLTPEYLVEVRSEDEDMIHLVRNNDPFEKAPVWIDESDNERHFGHGEHYGILKDPYYAWNGYQDNYITFLRTESITVPAGSFDCVVVFVYSEFHELEGLWGYLEMTVWANPEVGTVKTDEYTWMWDPFGDPCDPCEYIVRGTTELTSVSLVHPPEPEPAKGDLDGDGVIDFADLAFLAYNWDRDDCNISNQWCNETDLYFSGNVDELDLAVLCANWLNRVNLVGHWTMDDNAASTTVVDSSGDNNHGTAQQNTSNLHDIGIIDGALTFNGNTDFVDIPDDPSLDMTTELTVALWMKQSVLTTSKALVAKWDFQTQGCWAFQTDNQNSDELRVFIATALDDNGSGGRGYTTSANLVAGNWYHVAFVYDGVGATNADRLKIYVDGKEKALSFYGTIPPFLQNSSASVKIGKFGGTLDRYFNGIIDDVRIYNRASTAEEIEALAGASFDDWLVGNWQFDDCNDPGRDSSVCNNTAALIGAPACTDEGMSFDGVDDYLDISDNPSLDMTTKLTVALWMKQPVLAIKKALVAKWNFQTQGCWAFQTDNGNSDELRVFIATALDDNGSGGNGNTTSANLVAGNWYHVAFVYDGEGATNPDRLKIYVDGAEETLSFYGTIPPFLQNSSASVKIGKFGGTLDRYFNGIIDDVRVYDRALTAEEILELTW